MAAKMELVPSFSIAEIKYHDRRQLIEERVYSELLVPNRECIVMGGGMAAGGQTRKPWRDLIFSCTVKQ